jgi:hypothetical protein
MRAPEAKGRALADGLGPGIPERPRRLRHALRPRLAGTGPAAVDGEAGPMTRSDDRPFADRLEFARVLLPRGARTMPVHLADQLRAASTDTRHLHDRIGAIMPLLEPGRNWRQRMDASPSTETRAFLLAAVLGCSTVCPHLKRGGPQPAIARLPLHRVDCERCVQTLRRPPPDESDRCDVCGRLETLTFHPFAVRLGPVLVAGDACRSCADQLGIVAEAVS